MFKRKKKRLSVTTSIKPPVFKSSIVAEKYENLSTADKSDLNIRNGLIAEDETYMAILEEIFLFLKYKKKPKVSISSQLKDYMLTTEGKEHIECFLDN